jgi:predicted TIM-barrel fold metal-dependent hydrolase
MTDDLPIVDAHHHLWSLSGAIRYPWLQQPRETPHFLGDVGALVHDYLPDDYRRDTGHHRVVATVHVEAECDRSQQVDETAWLTSLNASHGLPTAIVAHAWFHTDDAAAIVARQAAFPLVRGIRSKPVTRATPDAPPTARRGTMQDPKWQEGYRALARHGLSWDLRVPAWHLEEAAEWIAGHPDIPVVVNHAGLPLDRSDAGIATWRRGMRALAAVPHCHCKLSCLCLPPGPWSYDANRAIVLETIDTFGVERCMFASNFPVDGLQVGFERMFDEFKGMTAHLAPEQRHALFDANARRFYRL